MKSCAFVTTPNAWCVPRSFSLLTTNSDESTQIVGSSRSVPSGSVTKAGSMLPVAIACSAVAMRIAIVALIACAFIASCASAISFITPGSGPSSRIEPVSTNGTLCTTHVHDPVRDHAFATAPRSSPPRALVDRAHVEAVTARRGFPGARHPESRAEDRQLDVVHGHRVPSSAPTKPFSMNHTMSARARECTSAGPVTQIGYPPRSRSSMRMCAISA